MLQQLEKLKQRSGRHQLGLTLAVAEDVVRDMLECPSVTQASVVGSVRRMQDTIGNVNVLVASTSTDAIGDYVRGLGRVREIVESAGEPGAPRSSCGAASRSRCGSSGRTVGRRLALPHGLDGARPAAPGTRLRARLAPRRARPRHRHLQDGLARGRRGRRLRRARPDPIPPELREDKGEIELARERRLPRLIEPGRPAAATSTSIATGPTAAAASRRWRVRRWRSAASTSR